MLPHLLLVLVVIVRVRVRVGLWVRVLRVLCVMLAVALHGRRLLLVGIQRPLRPRTTTAIAASTRVCRRVTQTHG